jgi:Ca2+-binding RTX toxin-like protein
MAPPTAGPDTLLGTLVDDLIDGLAGNDTLFGFAGNDTLIGGLGDDDIYGDIGNDSITGGDDQDYLDGGDGNDTLFGGNGNDEIYGNLGDDQLYGDAGEDFINGNAGNDYINGGLGNDTLFGGGGNDIFDGSGDSTGLDTFSGERGDDVYAIYNSNTVVVEDAGFGNDSAWTVVNYTLAANVENMYLVGNVTGVGNASDNIISGYGLGDNTIYGLAGNDNLYGGEGNDYLNGGQGNDVLNGGAGNDILDGATDPTGLDTFRGEAGNDTYGVYNSGTVIIENPNGGNDSIWTLVDYTLAANVESMYLVGNTAGTGNAGSNTIVGYGVGDNAIYGLGGDDSLYGGDGNDYLNGGVGDDSLNGGAGNDVLDGVTDPTGSDTFRGGTGDDTYGVYNSGTIIIEDASEGNDSVWTSLNYTLAANVENLYLVGNAAGTGNGGNNTIYGYGVGNNLIDGGAGTDNLFGGVGDDTFVLSTTSADNIGDFGNGNDRLQISASNFGGGLGTVLLSNQLRVGAGATVANDAAQRFIYNTTNGDLFFDVDGNGASLAVKIANLSGSPALSTGSFSIIGGSIPS